MEKNAIINLKTELYRNRNVISITAMNFGCVSKIKGVLILAKGIVKTNAMRILDQKKVPFVSHTYDHSDGKIDGAAVARKMGQDPERVFKTLVTIGHSKNYYVFVIPVESELHLKNAAKAVGEKSVEMIHVKEINGVTGYIRGGCSPIGMKKHYVTVLDESCLSLPTMIVSGGKIGFQIELAPKDLITVCDAKTAQLTQDRKEDSEKVES